jgi:UDP-glucose 4-epimerase
VVAAGRAAVAPRCTPVITGEGRQTRVIVFVYDVAAALERAGSRGSGLVVNIGTGVQTSIRDLWTAIAGANAAEPEFQPPRVDEVARFSVSPVRARIHLSWSPWTTLPDGLGQLR